MLSCDGHIKQDVVTHEVPPKASNGENARFTDEEIRQNVQKYVDVVFGDQEPTLDDYHSFEGVHVETELTFELVICECNTWTPPNVSAECISFIRNRADNASSVPSYYFRFLRDFLRIKNGKVAVQMIRRVNEGKPAEVQMVLIDAMLTDVSFEFYHAGDRKAAIPLGLVGLSKVNNQPIMEIVKKNMPSCEELSKECLLR
jgi:hypothetical protein